MEIDKIFEGIAIGFGAGTTLMAAQTLAAKYRDYKNHKSILQWLTDNTKNEAGEQFRTTRTIASWCNLTEERVREICSKSELIFQSTGDVSDLWGIYAHVNRNIYQERGLRSL